jgi:hypothetical protein
MKRKNKAETGREGERERERRSEINKPPKFGSDPRDGGSDVSGFPTTEIPFNFGMKPISGGRKESLLRDKSKWIKRDISDMECGMLIISLSLKSTTSTDITQSTDGKEEKRFLCAVNCFRYL